MNSPVDVRLIKRSAATRAFILATVVVGIVAACLVLAQSWVLSSAVTTVFDGGFGTLLSASTTLILIFAGRAVLAWATQWLGHRSSAAVKSQLRAEITDAVLARPADSRPTGTLVNLVTTGLDALDDYYAKFLPQLGLAMTVPLIVLVVVGFSDLTSAIIILVTVPLIPIFMALVGWTTKTLTAKRWDVQTRLANYFADLVAGLPTLQSFGRARGQLKGLAKTESAHRRETMNTLKISFLSSLTLELLATLSVAVIAVTVGFRLLFGDMSFTTALFVLVIAPEAYLPIRQVGTHFHDSVNGATAARQAFDLIDSAAGSGEQDSAGEPGSGLDNSATKLDNPVPGRDPVVPGLDPGRPNENTELENLAATSGLTVGAATATLPAKPILEVRSLTHTYPNTDVPALAPISFSLYPGEILAVTGTSGGGKTTLLNSVLGFLTPTSGEILTNGQPISDWEAWRAKLAFVGQSPKLTPGTVGENIAFGIEAAQEELREVLDAAGGAQIPLEHTIGDQGAGVSAGETRRIAMARAILKVRRGANLLVMDEPTAGLDSATEAQWIAALRSLGVAALVVTHRPAVIKAADSELAIVPAGDSAAATPDSTTPIPVTTTPITPSPDSTTPSPNPATPSPDSDPGRPIDLAYAAGGDPATNAQDDEFGMAQDDELGMARDNEFGMAQDDEFGMARDDELGEARDNELGVPQPHVSPGDLPWSGASKKKPVLDELEPDLGGEGTLMHRLLGAVPHSRRRLSVAVILAFCATGASVALMGTSAWLISRCAEHPGVQSVAIAVVLVRFFGISRGAFRYLERIFSHSVALRMQSALRLEIYNSLSKTTLLGRTRGDLLARVLADAESIANLVVRVWIPFASSALVVIVATVFIAFFSPLSALILLASAVLAAVIVPYFASQVSKNADEQSVALRGKLGAVLGTIAYAAPDLVAYQLADSAKLKLLEVDAQLRSHERRSTWVQGVAEAVQMLAAGVAVIGSLSVGAYQIANGTLAPVMLAVLCLVPLSLHESLTQLAKAAQTFTKTNAALIRVAELVEAEPVGVGDKRDTATDAAPELVLEDLSAGWPGQPPVQEHLNLKVAKDERVALVGPSGIGKTTIATTVLGMIPPVAGSFEVRGTLGYLAQDAHIFSTSIAENVRIGKRDATAEEVQNALSEAGLGHFSLDLMVGETGQALSGGEERRLALARLLVGDYQVWILDEPTEHLDQITAGQILDDIWHRTEGRAVLAITHDPEVVARCDAELELRR
ncbi:MAG: thiol reductant ABC exporter subunit CydD [Propionibacteriaceae bacterium]|jgi:ATP-binding cassette subfamily C protein CydCD|nr:thiol reductant ABC exporter subunit CydD [Propionibacteriaceae bacterium]